MKIFAGLSVRSFASLLGVCVVGLLSLQCQARANELEDSFMSDSKLSVYIKNETDYPSGTVSKKDLKGFGRMSVNCGKTLIDFLIKLESRVFALNCWVALSLPRKV